MQTQEEESSKIAKRQKIEAKGVLVEVVKIESKKKQVKIKGPTFEVKQYKLSEVPETSTDKFKSRFDLYDKYKDDRKISIKEVSLVTVKDHAKNTLNLVVATKNRIA